MVMKKPKVKQQQGEAPGVSASVLVRGFDFGTSDEQIAGHMANVGNVESVQMIDEGSACVTFSSAEEAQAAVEQLQQTCIAGNKRYIDVNSMNPEEFLAGLEIDPAKSAQFMAMNPEQQQAVMAKGTLSTARDPTAVLATRMKGVKGLGKGISNFVGKGGDGKCTVLVRGFDFGTTDEQIAGHMAAAGTIEDLQWIDDGSACVTYSSQEEAQMAVQQLQQTCLPGNKRYIDVLPMNPEEFLAGLDIDMAKSNQFLCMPPEQQQAIMAKGTLSTARDPTAVLATRMKGVKGMGGGKGSSSFGGKGSLNGKFSVLVRGFDFGTSEDMIAGHMANVGTVQGIQWLDEGSACITYSSAEEAQAAVEQLQQTCIAGNKRYIDIASMDPEQFLAGLDIDMAKSNQFLCMPPEQQQAVMGKGTLATARDPTAVLATRMKGVAGDGKGKGMASEKGKAFGGKGSSFKGSFDDSSFKGAFGGKGSSSKGAFAGKGSSSKGSFGGKGSSFKGKCSVLVRGFDFGTTDDMIAGHMANVGTVQDLQWLDEGSACVTYSSPWEAQAAVEQLQQTCIAGNKRYIDVNSMNPEEFLAGHNIDEEKTMQFMSLAPEQQQAVMGKGTLATARDPSAVLATRMKGVGGGGKGSFGPAPGCGGGMKGSMGKGPYGGGSEKGGCMGKGGMGKKGKMAAMMQEMDPWEMGYWIGQMGNGW